MWRLQFLTAPSLGSSHQHRTTDSSDGNCWALPGLSGKKQYFANACAKASPKEISLDVISALLKCHPRCLIPGVGFRGVSVEFSFLQSKALY